MKQIQLFDGTPIDLIGFGCWGLGGGTSPNPSKFEASLAALRSAIEIGYRHFDTAEYYAQGASERLLGQAIRESGIPREEFFITTKVWPRNFGYAKTRASFEGSLSSLDMDYIDLYLIHWPQSNMPLEETLRAFNEFILDGRLNYAGVSNFSVSEMKAAQRFLDTPLANNQVPYSLVHREYARNGVLEYCRENKILLTAYSPVEEGRLRVNETLTQIAARYKITPYQVALAWLVQQANVIAIPMSMNPAHQKENFDAAALELDEDALALLDARG